mgnify:CR=1 FL=1
MALARLERHEEAREAFERSLALARAVGDSPGQADLDRPGPDLDLVVAGTENAVLMVESEADQLSEEVMLGAVLFGHEQMQVVIDAIRDLAAEVNKPIVAVPEAATNDALSAAVESVCGEALRSAYTIGSTPKIQA